MRRQGFPDFFHAMTNARLCMMHEWDNSAGENHFRLRRPKIIRLTRFRAKVIRVGLATFHTKPPICGRLLRAIPNRGLVLFLRKGNEDDEDPEVMVSTVSANLCFTLERTPLVSIVPQLSCRYWNWYDNRCSEMARSSRSLFFSRCNSSRGVNR